MVITPARPLSKEEIEVNELKRTYGDFISNLIIWTNKIGWLHATFFPFRALSVVESSQLEHEIISDPMFRMMIDGKATRSQLTLHFLEEIYKYKKELVKK